MRPSRATIGQLAAGHQHAKRDRQVESGAVFPDVGGGEVDGDAAEGKGEAGVGQGGPDPLPALAYGAVRQPDGGEGRQAAADVHLDVYRIGVDAEDGGGSDSGKHECGRLKGSRAR